MSEARGLALHISILVSVGDVKELVARIGDANHVVLLLIAVANDAELHWRVSRLLCGGCGLTTRGVGAHRGRATGGSLVSPVVHRRQGRHQLHILEVVLIQIGHQPLANGLAAPRRARELRKVAVKVLHVVHQLTHIVQASRGPHPAVRHVLKEEPGDGTLLVVEIAKKLVNGRVIGGIGVTRLLQVCHDNLYVDGHVETVVPLTQNGRPVKDTSRAKARPKERHDIRVGTFGRAGPKNHFFFDFGCRFRLF